VCVAVCRSVLRCCSLVDKTSSASTGTLISGRACCSVSLCVAVCCSVLWCVAVFLIGLFPLQVEVGYQKERIAVCCSVLHCVAVCCSVSHCFAVCCGVLQSF